MIILEDIIRNLSPNAVGDAKTKEFEELVNNLNELESFIDYSCVISKTDHNNVITYVNEKFAKLSGYDKEFLIGKNYNIIKSGVHSKKMWVEMYDVILNKKDYWNSIITNKAKDGSLYYVDTYIKANFSTDGKLIGYMSISQDVSQIIKSSIEIEKKNNYLEYAAKIIRHDMHSGINVYIPRGITALTRKLTYKDISLLKLKSPLKMIKEGLKHTQKVYKGVYAFTNLVKKDSQLEKNNYKVKIILDEFLTLTAYRDHVITSNNLPTINVNESLFCTAIDNLIRNGLKYNDSEKKLVKVYFEDNCYIVVEDNGRGLSQKEFEQFSKPYERKKTQKENGSGLGLNISSSILEEHGFKIEVEKIETGTKIKINIK